MNNKTENKETAVCDECGSEYCRNASKMPGLCPECSSVLYGYDNCSHIFENGRCLKCFWNGSFMNLYEQKRTKRTIIDLVNFIALKYEMIFGYEKSINNLYYYILGYISSKLDEKINEKIDERFHYDFNKWLYNKYADKIESGMPWNQIYNSLFINEDDKLSAFYSDFGDFIKDNMSD